MSAALDRSIVAHLGHPAMSRFDPGTESLLEQCQVHSGDALVPEHFVDRLPEAWESRDLEPGQVVLLPDTADKRAYQRGRFVGLLYGMLVGAAATAGAVLIGYLAGASA